MAISRAKLVAFLALAMAVSLWVVPAPARAAGPVCATPGRDGTATITGVVNTYYPGSATAAAGSTSITLGASTGSATAIAIGDLVLVIQMQDASIDSSNTSGYGGSGPERDYVAYGSNIEAASGLASLTGYGPDEPFRTGSYYADPITGAHGAIAALAALHARRHSGEGQFVDMALSEVAAAFFGEALMDYALNGTVRGPLGNRSGRCAPQGAYACIGADAWIALAVRDDAEFARLCRVIGREELVGDARFATHAARGEHHDALDQTLSAWAATVDHNEAARLLQAADVPAAPVLANWELLSNPHLHERGFYVPVVHPEAGVFPFPGAPCKLSETPVSVRLPAPRFAEHNDYVYRDLLWLPEASMQELRPQCVVDETPDTPSRGQL